MTPEERNRLAEWNSFLRDRGLLPVDRLESSPRAVLLPTPTNPPTPEKNAAEAKLGPFKSRQPAREWSLMNRLPTLLLLIARNEPEDWLAIEYAYVNRDWTDMELDAIHNALVASVHAETYYRDYC